MSYKRHYAGVSSLQMSKRDRDFNQSFKERLRVIRSDFSGSDDGGVSGVTAGGLYVGALTSGGDMAALVSGVKTGGLQGCSPPAHRSHTPVAPNVHVGKLKTAIGNMKLRDAPGPDNISPSFLKNLGSKAIE